MRLLTHLTLLIVIWRVYSDGALSTPIKASFTTKIRETSLAGNLMNDDLTRDRKMCNQNGQGSPVDIKIEDALPIYVHGLEFVNYDTNGEVWHRENNQSDSLTGFNDWEIPPMIRGGTLKGDYILWEFQQNYAPSLGHRINGAFYDFEAQFIHVIRGMTIEDARRVPGAISIVAVEFKILRQSGNSSDSHITRMFPKEQFGDFKEWITPKLFIPNDTTNFFTYNGSFTQQPCYSGVIWNVLTEPVIFDESHHNFSSRIRSVSESFRLDVPSIGNRTVLFNYGENRKPEDEGFPVQSLLIAIFGFTAIAVIFIRKCEHLWMPRGIEADDFEMEMKENYSDNV